MATDLATATKLPPTPSSVCWSEARSEVSYTLRTTGSTRWAISASALPPRVLLAGPPAWRDRHRTTRQPRAAAPSVRVREREPIWLGMGGVLRQVTFQSATLVPYLSTQRPISPNVRASSAGPVDDFHSFIHQGSSPA